MSSTHKRSFRLSATPILIALLFMPFITLAIFDARYLALQDSLCEDYAKVITSSQCDAPETREREKIISTGLYRHIGDYYGRDVGTSPSFQDDLYPVREISDEELNSRGLAVEEYAAYDEIQNALSSFNLRFTIGMLVSVVIASSAATILLQKTIAYIKRRRTKTKQSQAQPTTT